MATRWGIASAGKISSDYVTAMKALKDDHRVVAVGARSLADAQAFAKKHGVERAYGSYEELSRDPDVEIVYIGTIHPFHLPVAKLMVNAGKHVLCEKPLCINLKDTKELVALARQKKVFFMEGVWSRFFPVYKEMMKRINAGEIGDVIQVLCSFGHPLENIPRSVEKELGGGATLDLGVYCVQFASLIMGGERPEKVLAAGHLNDNGVDATTSATLVYSKGRVATLNCSIRCELPCEGIVVGTKGTLKVSSPVWCPVHLESPSGKFDSPLPDLGHSYIFKNGQGMMYEAADVRRCLQEGLLENPHITLDETLLLSEILESIRKQVGVTYPQDL
ncbi:trans-1,2-dihydrobenzene-1,2-diol dehydrogenase-like isoform X2 [Penaeus japonicus]|nr:trans-1,2-dihydrobenzene-1,2-diol dehydrogenase-like isoform X2 [Penaeus japonicus]XP_042892093.1 trans-1,2-dihydrobenzene-1,2-diol dehydrogenase-like isoform X2 [Penaeus japonicus]